MAPSLLSGLRGQCRKPQQTGAAAARVAPRVAVPAMRSAPAQCSSAGRAPGVVAPANALPGRASRRRSVQARAFFKNIFKTDPSEATRKKYQERVDAVNALEPTIKALSDDQLRAKTEEFKQRVQKGESLDSMLPEAFAVRAAARHCRRGAAGIAWMPIRPQNAGATPPARQAGWDGAPHAAGAAASPAKWRSAPAAAGCRPTRAVTPPPAPARRRWCARLPCACWACAPLTSS